jgi:hypothetical protein
MEPAKKLVLKKAPVKSSAPTPSTPIQKYQTPLATQVYENLREWYANLGQIVPPDELKVCREIDLAEIADAAKIEAAATVEAAKPVYGTPEFWKAYWIKKNAAKAKIAK